MIRPKSIRALYRKGQASKKGLTPVFHKDGNVFVGHIHERWGKGAGWWFRPLGRDHWSKSSYRSATAAILAMHANADRGAVIKIMGVMNNG